MFVRGEATILHADLDAFYASVEQRDAPHLRGRPVIVGGGVVLACSYEAKRRGVRTAMNGRQARALCPEAIVVPPRMHAYSAASKAVFAIFRDTTPLVEGLSIDEAFLEVGGLLKIVGPPLEIAAELRARVAPEVGLPITVGIARTKFLAKVASGVAKPDGLLLVPPHGERAFLQPLPVERLWGVGKVTSAKLHALGVRTVADAEALGEAGLVSVVGRAAGRHLNALAIGLDPRPVDTARRRRSVGSQQALGRRARSDHGARRDPRGHARSARPPPARGPPHGAHRGAAAPVRRLLARHPLALVGRGHRAHRHPAGGREGAAPRCASHDPRARHHAARHLARRASTTTVSAQLALPFDVRSGPAIDGALDAVQQRFGSRSVGRATQLRLRPALEIPRLDD